jgi:hypothetical protein
MAVDLETDRYCIGCGYNLRGIASDRCPECGLETGAGGGSQVPWEGRNWLGFFTALRRTSAEVIFRPARLVNAMATPVNPSSAWGFRLTISFLGALPAAILLGVAIWIKGGTEFLSLWDPPQIYWPPTLPYPKFWEVPLLWSAGSTRGIVLPIGFFLTLLLMSASPRVWLRIAGVPAQLRSRAGALCGYLCAPLAFLVIPTVAVALTWLTNDPNTSHLWPFQEAALTLGIVSLLLIGIAFLSSTLRFIRAASRCGLTRLTAVGVGILATWLMALVIGMVLFPILAGLIWVIIDSLRR